MDESSFIRIVFEYEELYKTTSPYYSQRKDNIWEEIGMRMNESGLSCKNRWHKLRNSYSRALKLRKTLRGQAAKQIKLPNYYKELNFLIPYMNDEEYLRKNIRFVEEYNESSNEHNFNIDSENISTSLNYYSNKNRPETSTKNNYSESEIALTEFFLNMAKTVKQFPIQDQVEIKSNLFSMVSCVEMKLAHWPTISESLSSNMNESSNEDITPVAEDVTPVAEDVTPVAEDDTLKASDLVVLLQTIRSFREATN